MAAPRICCLDLDTFFVSVERILDPSLERKQVVVGGRLGTISPTSSEAEVYPGGKGLYLGARDGRRRVRLLGVGLSNLGLLDS